jgi:2'-5' RNA ligase
MIRLFAALSLPDPITDRLAALQRGLPGRLTAPENMHVTLAFFGQVAETTAADIDAALGAVRAPRFAFWLDGAGAFGGSKPRLIHAVVRPDPALTALHDKVAQAGRSAGVPVDAGRFTPHVTLSRIAAGDITALAAAKALSARAAFLAGPIEATAFHLYRSDLGRAGPAYTALRDYPLV